MMTGTKQKIEVTKELTVLLENNHIQSLKSLCSLLLREVDILAMMKLEDEDLFINPDGISLDAEVARFEINLIISALRNFGGNQVKAARFLGLKHTTLNAKIKRYKLNPTDF